MARITVEDCLEHVDNIFDLVMIASRRARRLANGAPPLLDWENDKPTVLALREVAAGLVTPEILEAPVQTPEELFAAESQAQELLSGPPLPLQDDPL